MIIKAFSEYLHKLPEKSSSADTVEELSKWIKYILSKTPENHVENIIHTEISMTKNNEGAFLLVGKSKTGENLVEALYNFALSYDHHKFAKWLHNKKASDFKH